jgi:hypothetical protein
MDFAELDAAKKNGGRRGKPAKKKAKLEEDDDATTNTEAVDPNLSNDVLRTGRWTVEETAHCDNLIHQFMNGRLPLSDGMKLNEFLAGMLKSKQSRLTKKMKNAKLSSKTFKRTIGYLADEKEARVFSSAELAFFNSIPNGLERAEMKFHMAKEWRETFSNYCVSHGQALNVDHWLASVEEMDRRNQRAKEVERVKRREMMMGCALRQDLMNPDRGVLIDSVKSSVVGAGQPGSEHSSMVNAAAATTASVAGAAPNDASHRDSRSYSFMDNGATSNTAATNTTTTMSSYPSNHAILSSTAHDPFLSSSTLSNEATPNNNTNNTASPFLHKIIAYIHRHHVPFEYIDVWVPSFVPDTESDSTPVDSQQPKCRLCFAGSLITKQLIDTSTPLRRVIPLSPEDTFNLSSFGDYSESFSFDVGCGLPGRVYHMGVPTWEQSVHNAPLNHFERVGGAQQWGIRTVVGIPVPSPNVGRVVVVLYSRYDRPKDHDLVIRLTEEFTRLMPSPKWKLVVDVGEAPPVLQQQTATSNGVSSSNNNGNDNNVLASEVISMFGEHMPSNPSNPGFAYLQGFMSLRLLLLRPTRSEQEQDIVNTILSSYSSYKAGGRTRPDMALMLARDFMFLNQQHPSSGVQSSFLPMAAAGGGGNIHSNPSMHSNSNASSLMNAAPAPIMPNNGQHSSQLFDGNGYSQTNGQHHYAQQQQQQQQLPPLHEQEYYMMSDMNIEPAPVNNPQQQQTDDNGHQTPLDAAVENVECLLSSEDAGSGTSYPT